MEFSITVENLTFSFTGFGSCELQLTDEKEVVLRRSDFISPRTLAVHCDAAAMHLPRRMIKLLQNPRTKGSLSVNAVEGVGLEEIPSLEHL